MIEKSTKKIRDLSFNTMTNPLTKSIKVIATAMMVVLIFSVASFAQVAKSTIKGRIISSTDNKAVPGASVLLKGTTIGTTSDMEGNFSLQAEENDVLVVSYIGFTTYEVKVGNQTVINVTLVEDISKLNEVVVIGYGTQKKALNTGANLQVNGDDIKRLSTSNALQALQGQAPGVQISSTSGQPGEGMKVTVRGLGTIGNSGPLYIVDGVITNDIKYLNNNDIETITVLKDAASAAIYGSQAANGVVLITTRTGKSGKKAQITFDAYYGIQNVGRKANMLNSKEYASIMNEAAVNSGKLPIFSNDSIAKLGEGTDWIDKMFVKNTITQNYSIGASGGSETSVYSTSLSYLSDEGTAGGRALSYYERYNFRFNSDHKLYKDMIKIGQNLTFAYTNNNGIGVGNQYNNALRSAFNTSPFVPMYDDKGNYFDNTNAKWTGGTESNPYAAMVYGNQNRRNGQKLLGNVYVEIEPIKNLKFRSSLGIDYFADESRSFTPKYKLSIYTFNDFAKVDQGLDKGKTIMWDNLLSYGFNFLEDHRVDVMLGASTYKYDRSGIWGTNINTPFNGIEYAYLSNATNGNGTSMYLGGGNTDRPGPEGPTVFDEKRLSYFARLNYNYKETYLLNTTFRADGSSKFAKDNRWGYFPSVSAGWVISNEGFMESTTSLINSLKLRASWGQVGNQNFPAYQYLTPINFANVNYIFGPSEGSEGLVPGAFPSRLGNENLIWETSEQTDLGFDAQFLKGKLSLNFDWYNKTTKDWIVPAPILATAGAEAPYINGGDVQNKGVELALVYRDNAGPLNYTISVNGAANKNKVGNIPTADGIIHGPTNQLFNNSGEFYRAQSGLPIGYFWGLETNGIFQTEAEVASYTSGEGKIIQPTAEPGDVKYVDRNSDGIINDEDKTNIGNPNPDFTFGFSILLEYKGFDLSILANGVAGNEIVQSYRNQSSQFSNYTTAILDRWHGPGSSNSVPRVTEDNRNWTNFSDLYIQKGDFLRINNVTLGYDLSKVVSNKLLSQCRVYVSGLNLLTLTKYDGMDPEIGYGIDNGVRDRFSSGIDLGYYPRPRTYMVGVNIKF